MLDNYNLKSAFVKCLVLTIFVTPFIYFLGLQLVYETNISDLSINRHFESIYYALNMKTDERFSLFVYLALFTPLVAFLPNSKLKGEYGSAAFANNTLIKKMKLFQNNGIVLGKKGSKLLKYDTPLSSLVLAPPGTGKSSGISIPNLLTLKKSMIVLDPKDELFQITSKFRVQKFKSRIYKYNPLDENSVKFNPFSKFFIGEVLKENNELDENAWNKAESLVSEIAYLIYQEKDIYDYWIEEARSLFILLALWLIFSKGETNLPEIRAYSMQDYSSLIDEDNIEGDSLLAFIQKEIDILEFSNVFIPNRIKEELQALIKKADKEYSGVFGSFKSPLNIFANSVIAKNFSTNDLDILTFRTNLSTLYISIKEKDLRQLSMLNRVFIEFIYSNLLSNMPSENDIEIIGLFDEFPRFGKLHYLMELSSIGRAYKLPCLFIAQDYAQIKKTYNQDVISVLESTTAYKVLFPQTNEETARRYAELIGDFTVERRNESRNIDVKSSRSIQKQLLGQKLITKQDILSQERNTIYILAINNYKNPIKASPYIYDKDKKLLKELKK
ncbi:Conjugal transfer protein TraG [Aliarcobacter thereius]|uniref:type IV secretory system conjugative DNA transfer family protein n=1 Tax=Aliarcobacter thereius TaxID=544718 RepID=UPI0008276A86|nr:type IV secretory system conjugative DNA transfer family protein [Aliarcobacter thereius]OCL86011.1 Conjugal transfer protein TraG [Aliarcobacter thereius]